MKSKGFTIVEIIVVIAIISVLASVVVVGVGQYMQKAKDARLRADFVEIEKAARMDYANCGNWAPDVNQWQLPRFVTGVNSVPPNNPSYCSNPQKFYSGDFKANYYCTGCRFDWDNWTPWKADLAIGITLMKCPTNCQGILHGYPIIIDGFDLNDIYISIGSGDYW